MQIKIEIDVRPEELRRFLGLPDVSGLQEDVVAFLRDKIGAASEFDATQFVKSNIDVLRRTPGFKTILSRLRINELDAADLDDLTPAPKPRAKRKSRPRRATAKSGEKSSAGNDGALP